MSLITQCPACHTLFRVVPDQLRISEGWVRCGNCNEIFDGNAHLQTTRDSAADSAPVPLRSEGNAGASMAAPSAAEPTPATLAPSAAGSLDDDPVLQLRPREHAQPVPAAVAVALDDSALGDVVPRAGGGADDAPRFVQAAPRIHADAQADAMAALSFMRSARPPGFWQRKAGRRIGIFVTVTLLLSLGLQVVVHERDRIVAQHPITAVAMDGLCELLGCTVAPWRQIESLVIDSSGFVKVRADTYLLSASVRNTASVAVAVPALELTLTDSQDQPLVRKVLLAKDLAQALSQTRIAAGGELSVAVSLAVQPVTANGTFAGYRLLAFYP